LSVRGYLNKRTFFKRYNGRQLFTFPCWSFKVALIKSELVIATARAQH
jgi:hypothetical protein